MNTTVNTSLKTRTQKIELQVFDNTKEFAVTINESKARLIYNKYFKSASGGTVLSFFGTFLSCLTTLLTATFNDIWDINGSAAVLSAVFVILTGVFGVLTIVWGGKWIYTLVKLNESSFINDLKGNSTCRDSKKDC